MDFRTYLQLEVALTRRLQKSWRQASAPIYSEIEEATRAGQWAKAASLVPKLDLLPIGQQNREYIRYVLGACTVFGAGMAGGTNPSFVQSPEYRAVLDRATNLFLAYLQHGATNEVRAEVLQSIAHAEAGAEVLASPGPTEKAETPDRYVKPFVSFGQGGDEQLQLVSALHSNRLGTWGFVAEADARGLRTYRLRVTLDGRTSAYCREVASQNRIFKVEDARKLVNQSLSVGDPNDLRSVQPWPNQSRASIDTLKSLDTNELVARGLQIPPFHPVCRTILVQVSEENAGTKPPAAVPEAVVQPQVSTPDAFAELGQPATLKEVDHWNNYVGVNPVDVLSKLLNVPGQDLLEGKWKPLIDFLKNGDIVTGGTGLVDGAKVQIGATLDPFSGRFYLDQADFVVGNARAESQFLAKLIKAMIDIGGSIGAKAVVIEVSGSAVEYAKLGFVPSALSWQHIKGDTLDEIRGGALQSFYDQLAPDQQLLLTHILESNDESAVNLLVNLPWNYEGKTIGELILGDVSGPFSLNLKDAASTGVAKEFLGGA